MARLEILEVSPENLAEKQYQALLNHGVGILEKMIKHLKKGEFDLAKSMTNYSPAGDCMGTDKSFIDFDFTGENEGDDIQDLITKLKSLKQISKPLEGE